LSSKTHGYCKSIKQSKTLSTVSSPSLVVNNANLDDKASYVCYAENSIGVGQSTSTVLNVLGGNVFDCLRDGEDTVDPEYFPPLDPTLIFVETLLTIFLQ
jgi:hypothetical protein